MIKAREQRTVREALEFCPKCGACSWMDDSTEKCPILSCRMCGYHLHLHLNGEVLVPGP